uniref:Uncharacterized protein n=1 Tax=Ditylenchus dipsaci TaxID=166011 RepID=A0A915CPC2_9BILA
MKSKQQFSGGGYNNKKRIRPTGLQNGLLSHNFQVSGVAGYIQPDSIFICINTNQTYAAVTGLSILSGTVLAESVSFAVAFGIIKTLRANVESFSAKTYRCIYNYFLINCSTFYSYFIRTAACAYWHNGYVLSFSPKQIYGTDWSDPLLFICFNKFITCHTVCNTL